MMMITNIKMFELLMKLTFKMRMLKTGFIFEKRVKMTSLDFILEMAYINSIFEKIF